RARRRDLAGGHGAEGRQIRGRAREVAQQIGTAEGDQPDRLARRDERVQGVRQLSAKRAGGSAKSAYCGEGGYEIGVASRELRDAIVQLLERERGVPRHQVRVRQAPPHLLREDLSLAGYA